MNVRQYFVLYSYTERWGYRYHTPTRVEGTASYIFLYFDSIICKKGETQSATMCDAKAKYNTYLDELYVVKPR